MGMPYIGIVTARSRDPLRQLLAIVGKECKGWYSHFSFCKKMR